MIDSENDVPSLETELKLIERLELANQLFREFRTQCFWHSPVDLVITEELIPFVVKGLRKYGGHRGFLLADKLRSDTLNNPSTGRESMECL